MRVRILCYRGFTASSPRDIKNALVPYYPGLKRLWLGHPEMTFNPKHGDVVINWGCIARPDFWGTNFTWLNDPLKVAVSTHRIRSLTKLKESGINVPEFTTDVAAARSWKTDGRTVVCRKELRSFGGHGITLVGPDDGDVPANCALYTRYQPKRHEYRIHVFRGSVIDVQQKKRKQGDKSEGVESKIRSHANGWVFAREGVSAPQSVLEQARKAVESLSLDFSAVDVGWTEKGDVATVYECNTAPGLEGTSITKYVQATRSFLQSL